MPRTILLTNIVLSRRSGTEVVTEQLADALRSRGHRVFVFTPQIGPLAERMRTRGHIVVDRPAALPQRPDIIHAHHTGPAMAALVAHPGVPALFVCHDATAPFDTAPPHPRLRRLLAVDERCRARLVAEGADADRIELLPNAVDLSRIPPRPAPLPDRPRRAVIVAKGGDGRMPEVRAACEAAGIAVTEIGPGSDTVVETPEAAFATADIVFASGRSALEAAAAGAGVVICDGRGFAGFLTRARAEAWLPWNLGAGILAERHGEAVAAAAIAEWSATEAAAATALLRETRALSALVDRIEAIHEAVIADPGTPDPAADAAAASAFIAGWVPNFDLQAPWHRLSRAVGGPLDTDALPARIDALAGRIGELAGQQARMIAEQPSRLVAEAEARILTALAAEAAAREERTATLQASFSAQSATIEALLRNTPSRRACRALAAAWRAIVPRAIREPLWRWRTGRRSAG